MSKKTLVIGASENTSRYSNQAVRQLLKNNHEVVALGGKVGEVENVQIKTNREPFEGIDTVTLYINAKVQEAYKDYVLGLKPKRVIFNPGTENPQFYKQLSEAGIEVEEACTLVMLSIGNY